MNKNKKMQYKPFPLWKGFQDVTCTPSVEVSGNDCVIAERLAIKLVFPLPWFPRNVKRHDGCRWHFFKNSRQDSRLWIARSSGGHFRAVQPSTFSSLSDKLFNKEKGMCLIAHCDMLINVKWWHFDSRASKDFSVNLRHHSSWTILKEVQFVESATIEASEMSWHPDRLTLWSNLHLEQNSCMPLSVNLQWEKETSCKFEQISPIPPTMSSFTAESSLTSSDVRCDPRWAKNCVKPFGVIFSNPQSAKCSTSKSVLWRNDAKMSSLKNQLLSLSWLSLLVSLSSLSLFLSNNSSNSDDTIVTRLRVTQFSTK